ncbi:bifunctional DNA primase/polymerase [Actinacidiphila acididurans]|uniref:bifunctional DNA primase/polymerase n=1 Tax=Actinacidiphila acididurans TaxID=2784346 RepID=UPI0027DB30F2|nr:bifunctional DNA primase/polymerase [Actinacidiphila acididurans]
MEDTLGVPRPLAVPGPLGVPGPTGTSGPAGGARAADGPRAGSGLLDAALRYAEEWHWDVVAGSWLEAGPDGAPRCSCASPACPAPGAHPAGPGWAAQASGGTAAVRRMWREEPRASVLLPTGRGFDAIDVSESAGLHALARMERLGVRLGPVIATPARRLVFLAQPGTAAKLPDLLARHGAPPASLDLVLRGDGDWVAAPPTRTGRLGVALWAREPAPAGRWLPDADAVAGPLAYVCGREAAQARRR